MVEVNDWREAVCLPVVSFEKSWNLDELEDKIFQSVSLTVKQALKANNGLIFTTLSGGVDSPLCLAMICEICPPGTEIQTFTAGGSIKHPDIQFARGATHLFKTKHHEIIRQGSEDPYFVAYREIVGFGFGAKSLIAHDGIDELLGGYWPHCDSGDDKTKQVVVFEEYWQKLRPNHLLVQEQAATENGIKILLPYLQKDLVEYISHIPVSERAGVIVDTKTGYRLPDRKKPLRALARRYFGNLPGLRDIPDRQKRGFADAFSEK